MSATQSARPAADVGFFYVRGHGVPESVIAGAQASMRDFFALPLDDKMVLDIRRNRRHRGYVPLGGVSADPGAMPDLQEGYEVSLELPDDDPDYRAGNIMYGPNVWPESPPGFRQAIYGYYEQVLALGRMLFKAFALALELTEDVFDDKIDKPMGQLRLVFYPPQKGPIDGRRIGIGAHTDYECFTILWQDAAGGLQVGNHAGD